VTGAETSFYSACRSGVDAEKIVKRHIQLLHQYNEAKDTTQVRIYALDYCMLLVLTL
jgi:Swi5